MRKGAKAAFVRRLGEMKLEAETLARDIEAASEGPPFSLSVGWGNAPQAIISIDDREVHRHVLEEHVDKCIWALFESCRDGGDPGDPKAFKRVLDRINAEARKRCFQRDETPTRSEE